MEKDHWPWGNRQLVHGIKCLFVKFYFFQDTCQMMRLVSNIRDQDKMLMIEESDQPLFSDLLACHHGSGPNCSENLGCRNIFGLQQKYFDCNMNIRIATQAAVH